MMYTAAQGIAGCINTFYSFLPPCRQEGISECQTVDKNGKATAWAPGCGAIAVTAQNGITKKIIVRVQ